MAELQGCYQFAYNDTIHLLSYSPLGRPINIQVFGFRVAYSTCTLLFSNFTIP